jgi:uncharacterized protein YecE (DUF72 family)
MPLALELPHASWHSTRVQARIGDAGAAMVATDWDDRDEPALEGGGAFIYLRLRRARYGPDQLDRWAARLDPLLAGGSDVFVFFRHDEDGLMALQAEALLGRLGGVTGS